MNKVAEILRQNHEVIILKTQDTKDAKDIFKNISVESFDRMVIAGVMDRLILPLMSYYKMINLKIK